MSWWQILLVIASQLMCWYVGKQTGYLDGWYARGIADDERFIERTKQAAKEYVQVFPRNFPCPRCQTLLVLADEKHACTGKGEESAP